MTRKGERGGAVKHEANTGLLLPPVKCKGYLLGSVSVEVGWPGEKGRIRKTAARRGRHHLSRAHIPRGAPIDGWLDDCCWVFLQQGLSFLRGVIVAVL